MAFTVNRLPWQDGSAGNLRIQGEGTLAAQLTEEHSLVYQVVSDVDTTAYAAMSAPGIPLRGAVFAGSNGLVYVTGVDAQPKVEGTQRVFVVTVRYESVPIDPFQPEAAIEKWATASVEEPVDQDRDGVLICNSADETFDPPIVRAFDDWVMTRSRNIATFSAAVWSPFRQAVNWDTAYRGFPAKTARVVSMEFEPRTHGTFTFWRFTYVVAFRSRIRKGQNGAIQELGWTDVKANLGFRKKVNKPSGGGYTYETLLDSKRMPLTAPVPLSADGYSMVAKDQFTVREFKNNPTADLTQLDTLTG